MSIMCSVPGKHQRPTDSFALRRFGPFRSTQFPRVRKSCRKLGDFAICRVMRVSLDQTDQTGASNSLLHFA